jgi:oligosaccharide repeat unit polymerase
VNLQKVILTSFSIVLLFFIIGNVRMNQTDAIKKSSENYTPAKFMNNVAGIKFDANIIESTFTVYSSMRYSVMNKFVKKSSRENYYAYGIYTFRPFVSLLCLDRLGIVDFKNYEVNKELATYAIDPYLDFGILGVLFINFFYGIISRRFYRKYTQRNYKYIIPWVIIIFCLIMSPFMNYFSSFFIWMIWITNKIII